MVSGVKRTSPSTNPPNPNLNLNKRQKTGLNINPQNSNSVPQFVRVIDPSVSGVSNFFATSGKIEEKSSQDADTSNAQVNSSNAPLFRTGSNIIYNKLINAAVRGTFEQVEAEFRNNVELDPSDQNDISAFMWAVLNGHTELALNLIDLMSKSPEGIKSICDDFDFDHLDIPDNLFTWTVHYGQKVVALKLMDLMSKSSEGMEELCTLRNHCDNTPLIWLISNYHIDIAFKLIDILQRSPEGIASICKGEDDYQMTALVFAINQDEKDLAFKLIEIMSQSPEGIKAINVDNNDDLGTDESAHPNALLCATNNNHQDIVKRIKETFIINYSHSIPQNELHEFYTNTDLFYEAIKENAKVLHKNIITIISGYEKETPLHEAIATINFYLTNTLKQAAHNNMDDMFDYIQSIKKNS